MFMSGRDKKDGNVEVWLGERVLVSYLIDF